VIVALILGTLLSLVVLGYVLAPVVMGVRPRAARPVPVPMRRDGADDLAIAALREIEFDRATGKLSDADYATLRERYASQALAAMRADAPAAPSATVMEDAAEAAVRAYRSAHPTCAGCGIRPETDAIYCSNCGNYLPGKCVSCGTAVTASGVRYCIDCGTRLAA
jgi:hypothetical protein